MIVPCSHCGNPLDLPDTLAEKQARCSRCGELVTLSEQTMATLVLKATPTKPVPSGLPGFLEPAAQISTNAAYDFLSPGQAADELGRLGPYRVLKVLGSGGMGVVFHAEDMHLRRPVALKCLLPAVASNVTARQRFLREAQAAAAIEHDHIVVIYQVGEDRGVPFLAMQLLQGEALEDRLGREGKLPVAEVLRIGREIAAGLAAAHQRGLIHRDIKPANIWLEGRQARVKLLDFGLARAVAGDNQVTQAGMIMGTPAYMAPEQATGQEVDARCDLFSLGCVLYRMATGRYAFTGKDTISTLLAVANKQPEAPRALSAELPSALSDLVMTLLAKDPNERPPTAEAVVEIIREIERDPNVPAWLPPPDTKAPVNEATIVSAPRSQKTLQNVVATTSAALPAATGAAAGSGGKGFSRGRWLLLAGFGAVLLAAGAVLLPQFLNRSAPNPDPNAAVAAGPVEIGIAYGTETKKWLQAAVREFAKTDQGKDIKVNLLPMGSQEGGQAVWKDENHQVHVWAPASGLYKETLVRQWQIKYGRSPILKEADLALTPLVFVLWEERYPAFIKKYKTVTFTAIRAALSEKEGWDAIAQKPDWGSFKFGHADPLKSNSGLMTLLAMAHEFHKKKGKLSVADVTGTAFQNWVAGLEQGVSSRPHSTGTLIEDMVLHGPSSYDAVVVYENLVMDYAAAAEGRWGKFRVAYPPCNLWSEHPYYILDVPWSSKEQRQAADVFLTYLLSEPMQKEVLHHGFRPVNVEIPIRNVPDSPFVRYKDIGLQIDVKSLCEPPSEQIIDNLLLVWSKLKPGVLP